MLHKSVESKIQQHIKHFHKPQAFYNLKTRLLKCFVWSILMYVCETWTLTTKSRKNVEAAEMWFYRGILRIPWTALQTIMAVFQRMGQRRKPLCYVD